MLRQQVLSCNHNNALCKGIKIVSRTLQQVAYFCFDFFVVCLSKNNSQSKYGSVIGRYLSCPTDHRRTFQLFNLPLQHFSGAWRFPLTNTEFCHLPCVYLVSLTPKPIYIAMEFHIPFTVTNTLITQSTAATSTTITTASYALIFVQKIHKPAHFGGFSCVVR